MHTRGTKSDRHRKKPFVGPTVRYLSNRVIGKVITFTDTEKFPKAIHFAQKHVARPKLCVITGKPAKYRDPLTGQPYANLRAFRILRERFSRGGQIRQTISDDYTTAPESLEGLIEGNGDDSMDHCEKLARLRRAVHHSSTSRSKSKKPGTTFTSTAMAMAMLAKANSSARNSSSSSNSSNSNYVRAARASARKVPELRAGSGYAKAATPKLIAVKREVKPRKKKVKRKSRVSVSKGAITGATTATTSSIKKSKHSSMVPMVSNSFTMYAVSQQDR